MGEGETAWFEIASCNNLNKVQMCNRCGCIMPVKTWLKFSECPDKKWMQQ